MLGFFSSAFSRGRTGLENRNRPKNRGQASIPGQLSGARHDFRQDFFPEIVDSASPPVPGFTRFYVPWKFWAVLL